MPIEMYQNGYRNIVNVDYSDLVITEMESRYKQLTGMTWLVMDICDMSQFADASFDIVLEKGTLDAMLVNEPDPWRISQSGADTVDRILREVSTGGPGVKRRRR